MKIELHVFTNCTRSAPSTQTIKKTTGSFYNTFGCGVGEPSIWVDPAPNRQVFNRYKKILLKIFRRVYPVMSLSHGYITAVARSNADFLFMLEHDWIFNAENIKHSLELVCEIMHDRNLIHMRFNKRKNKPMLWDKTLKEVKLENYIDGDKFYWCETPALSNNPHIINRKLWIEKCLQHVEVKPGSKGIEENLTARKELNGCIYGPLNWPACVKHLDGRS